MAQLRANISCCMDHENKLLIYIASCNQTADSRKTVPIVLGEPTSEHIMPFPKMLLRLPVKKNEFDDETDELRPLSRAGTLAMRSRAASS